MKKYLMLLFPLSLLCITVVLANTPLPFGDTKHVRSWSTSDSTIYLTVDADDLKEKQKGASKLWVVISARYVAPKKFWNEYPEFTEKCIVGKTHDFKWIEAIPVPLKDVKSNQFRILNAKGTYYGFVIVEKGGELEVVKPKFIGGKVKYKGKSHYSGELFAKDKQVKVKNPKALVRNWSDDNMLESCK